MTTDIIYRCSEYCQGHAGCHRKKRKKKKNQQQIITGLTSNTSSLAVWGVVKDGVQPAAPRSYNAQKYLQVRG